MQPGCGVVRDQELHRGEQRRRRGEAGAPQRQIDHVVERVEQLGLRSHVVVGTEITVIAALGEKRDGAKQSLETMEGVEKIVPILAPYKIASNEVRKEPTQVRSRQL